MADEIKHTQCMDIRNFLEEGGSLTAVEALFKFKCARLASRINELKKAGYNVKKTVEKDESGKRWARYSKG